MSVKLITVVICWLWVQSFLLNRLGSSMYSGSWCPYQVEKQIPCRVRNGTEPYLGPNICWRSLNGSYSCTKKILYRPKYITTFKKIFETSYKCCPGYQGAHCQYECFNCSVLYELNLRLNALEKSAKVSIFGSNYYKKDDLDKSIEANSVGFTTPLNEALERLQQRMTELESRMNGMESEIEKLSSSLYRKNLINDSYSSPAQSDEDVAHRSPISRNDSDLKLSAKNNYEQDKINRVSLLQNSKDGLVTVAPDTEQILEKKSDNAKLDVKSSKMKESMDKRATMKYVRRLEENLERGDIASTLNDDYGEEIYFENSTEQYVDRLYALL